MALWQFRLIVRSKLENFWYMLTVGGLYFWLIFLYLVAAQ